MQLKEVKAKRCLVFNKNGSDGVFPLSLRSLKLLSRDLWGNELLRFLVVGAGNTVFGYLVYLAGLWSGLPYQVAAIVATVLGVIFNFFTTGTIVFRNAALGRIFGFFAVYGFTLIVNLIVLTRLVEAGVSKALAQALVLPLVVILSFLLNKFLVFRKRP
jgi:putative flippase GtrA